MPHAQHASKIFAYAGDMHLRASFVIGAVLSVAATRPAWSAPTGLHKTTIPDGERWFCAPENAAAPSSSTCEREETWCQSADQGGNHCSAQDTAWVATGQDRKTRRWKWVAAPTRALCAARVQRELSDLASVSACAQVGKTDGVPPDATLIPKGKGWWCYRDVGTPLSIGPPGSPTHCARTRSQCRRDHWGITNEHTAILTTREDIGCVAAATAHVFTTNDDYRAAQSAADCEAERQASREHTACAAIR
jgi:hypothetical protein